MPSIEEFMHEIHLMEKEFTRTVLCHASLYDRLVAWKESDPMGAWYTIVASDYIKENQIIIVKSDLLEIPAPDATP